VNFIGTPLLNSIIEMLEIDQKEEKCMSSAIAWIGHVPVFSGLLKEGLSDRLELYNT
jgi:hypothetical protein